VLRPPVTAEASVAASALPPTSKSHYPSTHQRAPEPVSSTPTKGGYDVTETTYQTTVYNGLLEPQSTVTRRTVTVQRAEGSSTQTSFSPTVVTYPTVFNPFKPFQVKDCTNPRPSQ